MARRINPELAAFVPVGPEGDLLRIDRRPWRDVIVEAMERISDPSTRPDIVAKHVAEVVSLAEAADRIRAHFFSR